MVFRGYGLAWTFSRVFRCTDICSLLLSECLGPFSPTQWLGGLGSTLGDGGSLNLAPAYVFSPSLRFSSAEGWAGHTLSFLLVSTEPRGLFPSLRVARRNNGLLGWLLLSHFLVRATLAGMLLSLLFWLREFRLGDDASCLFRLWMDCPLDWFPLSTLPVFDFSSWEQMRQNIAFKSSQANFLTFLLKSILQSYKTQCLDKHL